LVIGLNLGLLIGVFLAEKTLSRIICADVTSWAFVLIATKAKLTNKHICKIFVIIFFLFWKIPPLPGGLRLIVFQTIPVELQNQIYVFNFLL
jgi:hypothetical protein